MSEESKIPTLTVPVEVIVHVPPDQQVELRKMANLHHLGDECSNHYVNGRLVSKYPEKETEALIGAHYSFAVGRRVRIAVTFDANGKVVRQELI